MTQFVASESLLKSALPSSIDLTIGGSAIKECICPNCDRPSVTIASLSRESALIAGIPAPFDLPLLYCWTCVNENGLQEYIWSEEKGWQYHFMPTGQRIVDFPWRDYPLEFDPIRLPLYDLSNKDVYDIVDSEELLDSPFVHRVGGQPKILHCRAKGLWGSHFIASIPCDASIGIDFCGNEFVVHHFFLQLETFKIIAFQECD